MSYTCRDHDHRAWTEHILTSIQADLPLTREKIVGLIIGAMVVETSSSNRDYMNIGDSPLSSSHHTGSSAIGAGSGLDLITIFYKGDFHKKLLSCRSSPVEAQPLIGQYSMPTSL